MKPRAAHETDGGRTGFCETTPNLVAGLPLCHLFRDLKMDGLSEGVEADRRVTTPAGAAGGDQPAEH